MHSSFIVAHDAVTPTHYMRPGVIGMPLATHSSKAIFVVAHLITMTPGTLSLDVSTDCKTLYIHCMYLKDVQKTRRKLKDIEHRVLRIGR